MRTLRSSPFIAESDHDFMARKREAEEKVARFKTAVDRCAEARNPQPLREFWGDPDFIAYVAGVLVNLKKLEQDSADLSVIARVFGGSAR